MLKCDNWVEMNSGQNTEDRMRSVLVIVATITTIVFNALAATGYVNGITPAAISAKYATVLTPAGYAFSIWTLIYVGLLAFSVYQALPANAARYRPIRSLYILSCLLNCTWIYFWHREQIAICLAIILLLCGTLIFMRYRLMGFDSTGDTWLAKAPFGLYAGWVTAASMVNFLVLLAFLKAGFSGAGENVIGIALIAIVAIVAVARIAHRMIAGIAWR